MKKLLSLSILLPIIIACGGDRVIADNQSIPELFYEEGVHYRTIEHTRFSSDNYHIEKYFWIGCEHCQNLEKIVSAYQTENADTKIKRIHAPLMDRWILDSRIYYALVEKDRLDLYQDLIEFYENFRIENGGLPEIKDLENFLSLNGLNYNEFFKIADSEKVTDKLISVRNNMMENEITSVPTVIVNGKYKVKQNLPTDIQTQEDYNNLLNYLINKKENNEE